MTARSFSITMDAADPRALGEFWAHALGYVMEAPPPPYADWPEALAAWGVPESEWNSAYAIVDPAGEKPRVFLQRVPEAKVAKNRIHLDVHCGAGRPGEKDMDIVRRVANDLVGAGAVIVQEYDSGQIGQWIVMTDPEGNEFCVV
jgi:hypothetical protein